MEVLAEAVQELNGQLENGRVDLHLAGDSVSLAFAGDEPAPAPEPVAADDDLTARITLRLPETLKAQAETAAASEGISTNAWLTRAVAHSLGKPSRGRPGRRVTGYAQS